MIITAKTTPRAISSLFSFNKTANRTRSSKEPKVINLPNLPSDFKECIPDRKSKLVKKRINK